MIWILQIKAERKDYDESIIGHKLVITFREANNDWLQWRKTIGNYAIDKTNANIAVDVHGEQYSIAVSKLQEGYMCVSTYNDNTPSRSLFLKKLRIVCRKSHYCVSCRVCMANCKYGNLVFDEKGKLSISDKCIKCGKCLEIDTGCYVYKSLWLSKGLGSMNKKRSIDCYAAHGPKMEWFSEYVKLGERFKTECSLGNNQVPAFNRFLRDSGVVIGDTETKLGAMLRDTNLEDNVVWALMLANLAYTPEVGWYISHFGFNEFIPQSSIVNTLSTTEGVSASALKSIPAALKRIAALPLKNVGFGFSEKSTKEDGGTRFIRTPWLPSPEVILYSLYKFAEACDGYYQFTMSRLYDNNVESDGVSPVRIFGIEEEEMKKMLKGLAINHSDFISVTFTLDLDNINLKEDKTAQDVLDMF